MDKLGSNGSVDKTNMEKWTTPDLSDCSDDMSSRNRNSASKFSSPTPDLRFPLKTFYIINESHVSTPEIACWSEGGDALIIKTKAAFEEKYLSISFESFVRQLHLYGFRKANQNKGSTREKRKMFIFRHEDFQQGREDQVCSMQTVKREKKMARKLKEDSKTKLDDVIEKEDEAEQKKDANSVEHVDGSMHMKMDRIDCKVESIYSKLEDLSIKLQTSLSLFHTAGLSDFAQYQPIPMFKEEDMNVSNKRRRHSYRRTFNDSKEETIPRHLELSEIPPELSNARRSYGESIEGNNRNSQLTLDTDEMEVIETLMNCDDNSVDGSKIIDHHDTNVRFEETSGIKMQMDEGVDQPLIPNTGPPIVFCNTNTDDSAVEAGETVEVTVETVEAQLMATTETLQPKKKSCHKNGKIWIFSILAFALLASLIIFSVLLLARPPPPQENQGERPPLHFPVPDKLEPSSSPSKTIISQNNIFD